MRDLLHPLVVIRRRPAAAGHVRVGVLEFAGGELVDAARLRLAYQLGNELDTMWKVTVFLSSSTV